MDPAAWRDAVELACVLPGAPAGAGRPELRALLRFWNLAMATPQSIMNATRELKEADLSKPTEQAEAKIIRNDFSFEFDGAGTAKEMMLTLAAQVRALDKVAFETRPAHRPVANPNEEWRVRVGNTSAHLIPFAGKRLSVSRAFKRSVLRHHRILPEYNAGIPLKLFHSDVTLGDATKLNLGGGLFPGLQLKYESVDGGFLVREAVCPDQPLLVTAAMRAAHLDECGAIIFPELTMPAPMRDLVETELRRRPWKAESSHTIGLVVAGSWHAARGAVIANQAVVFDGYGDVVLSHDKLLAYVDPTLGPEKISPGSHISICVLEDAIVAVGICLDFCEECESRPYEDLDVDLILVPSFGKSSTMAGHIAAARQARIQRDARAVVVQQVDPDELTQTKPPGAWTGYVLFPPPKTASLTPENLRVMDAWVTNSLKRKG